MAAWKYARAIVAKRTPSVTIRRSAMGDGTDAHAAAAAATGSVVGFESRRMHCNLYQVRPN